MRAQGRSKSTGSPKKNLFLKFFLIFVSLGAYQTLNRIGYGFHTISDALGGEKYAYATLLCDDQMAEAAMVLVHSVKRTGSPHEFIVLTLNVSNQTVDTLRYLGAKVSQITNPVPYPFPATASRKVINKPCRYSKLLIWDLIQYNKIVYLDADLLVVQNIDDLFDRPTLTAVADSFPPDKFNSGVMVIVPNRRVFLDMLDKISVTSSPNVGDQGFLNNYFKNWFSLPPAHHLDPTYNALIRFSTSHAWKKFLEPNLKVLHFSGSTKPWNMMQDRHMPTTRQYDHVWWRMHDDMIQHLYKKFNDKSMFISDELISEQCKYDFMQFKRKKTIDKLSIVINSFDRFDLLTYMIHKYSKMSFVHKIYIIWGNTHVTPFSPSYFNVSKPVEIIYTGIDSLNDRFKPIKSLETEAVLICDDDIEVNAFALRAAFERWSDDKNRLVGFFPRGHYMDEKTNQYVYLSYPKGEYSIVLTKMFIMHADYLRMYTCHVPTRLHEYVDYTKNCEDIAINFLASRLSHLSPLVMEDVFKKDYGTTSGLSKRKKHHTSRSDCMSEFSKIFGHSLLNTSDTLTYVQKLPMKRTLLDDVMDMQPIVDKDDVFLNSVHFSVNLKDSHVAFTPSIFSGFQHLCLTTNINNRIQNFYALRSADEISFESAQFSGLTVVIHIRFWVSNFIAFTQLLSSLLYYRQNNGCFGASRVILFRNNVFLNQTDDWTDNLLRAVLGGYAKTFPLPQIPKFGCFEKSMIVRQKTSSSFSDCSDWKVNELRNLVRPFCRKKLATNKLKNYKNEGTTDRNSNTTTPFRISIIGSKAAWKKIGWFSYPLIRKKILELCKNKNMECEISDLFLNAFCIEQVHGENESDMFILTSESNLKFLIFSKSRIPILQILPHIQKSNSISTSFKDCFDFNFQQLKHTSGVEGLLKWVDSNLHKLQEDQATNFQNSEPFQNQCFENHEIY